MDKFFNWMIKKQYAEKSDTEYEDNRYNYVVYDLQDEQCFATKQMLIGYMVEYLVEVDTGFSINIFSKIEYLYEWLEKKIQGLNK